MLYILFGLLMLCALLCFAQLVVCIWEHAELSARRTAQAHASRKAVRLNMPVRLPDRDSVKNIYSLSDQFADHFREVMSS